MGCATVGIATAILLFLSTAGIARGEELQTPGLVVRTYNGYVVSNKDLQTARNYADAVLREAGVYVMWLDCGGITREPLGTHADCRQTPASNELLVQIERKGPTDGTQNVSMGFSLVSRKPGGRQPSLCTVFADVVMSVARKAHVDSRRVLGRAIAHEIGHLLLNDAHHSSAGLMRGIWSTFELQRNNTTDWLFLKEEVATMREAVAARSHAAR